MMYVNDDSENQEDDFTFVSSVIVSGGDDDDTGSYDNEIQEFTETFYITMSMIDDNPPVRSVDKVFNVATGQSKRVTVADLAFTDPDVNFDDSLLTYHFQTVSNGDIINTVTRQPVLNFTQNDLIKGTVLYQHKGSSYSRTSFSVSDGVFTVSGMFEVRAALPYVRVNNNTGRHLIG